MFDIRTKTSWGMELALFGSLKSRPFGRQLQSY
jgi:hypothetical protein